MQSGDRNTAEAELEGKAWNTLESNTETPAFGRVKQSDNQIKKLKQNSRGLTK